MKPAGSPWRLVHITSVYNQPQCLKDICHIKLKRRILHLTIWATLCKQAKTRSILVHTELFLIQNRQFHWRT